MENRRKLTIGLFGFGVVGEGLYKALQQTPTLDAVIKKICIRDMGKRRNAPSALFTTDRNELLADRDINLIVEVIDDAEAAFGIVRTALLHEKDVVSASKKMIAEHLPELMELQRKTGRSLLYEAAACASIPVIRNLEEYYDNDLLCSLRGVVNGSTNFILTRMFEDGLDFRTALLQAQQLGFAESDPCLDVDGHDAANKWIILLQHAYGIGISPDQLLYHGIASVTAADAALARSQARQIKLVAQAEKNESGEVTAFVLPQFIEATDPLAYVRQEYNGLVIESGLADRQFFYGKGAGSFPTASAILSDLSALRYGYRYEYKKQTGPLRHVYKQDGLLRVYISAPSLRDIPRDKWEWIEEAHAGGPRPYLTGVVAMEKLQEDDWWKIPGCSLILQPDPLVRNAAIRQLKQRSLELAGIDDWH